MSGVNAEYRKIAEQIVRRAEQDEDFAKQAKADPLAALSAAGFSADAAKQVGQLGQEAEVSGYAMCQDTTCWSSQCPGTCIVSWTNCPLSGA